MTMMANSIQASKTPATFDKRRAGVILHPTSLPGVHNQGDLGPDAYRFLDFMQECGLSIWQMLPVCPTHDDRSPYMGTSAYAGNPELISLELLEHWGWLSAKDFKDQSVATKKPYLNIAYQFFVHNARAADQIAFEEFISNNKDWLWDYALFVVLREQFNHQSWNLWPLPYRQRDPESLTAFQNTKQLECRQVCFEQFVFYRQWHALKQYANDRKILIMGDMPIFVAHDSADVWQHRNYFDLNEDGSPRTVAGVPPDYFSETGQRWGNPLYRWDILAKDDFRWWVDRFQANLILNDVIRVDHFRGFEAYWQIDANEKTAINGHWVKAPGEALFNALLQKFDTLPLVVEDLGTITAEVEALRKKFGWPGMKILQFAFDGSSENPYLPHHHVQNCVVYTGTHDNDTSLNWYEELPEQTKNYVNRYFSHPGDPMPWPLVEAAFRSVAEWAIVPMQDLLFLGKGNRMNQPGVPKGNWVWRFQWQQVDENLSSKVNDIVTQFERDV